MMISASRRAMIKPPGRRSCSSRRRCRSASQPAPRRRKRQPLASQSTFDGARPGLCQSRARGESASRQGSRARRADLSPNRDPLAPREPFELSRRPLRLVGAETPRARPSRARRSSARRRRGAAAGVAHDALATVSRQTDRRLARPAGGLPGLAQGHVWPARCVWRTTSARDERNADCAASAGRRTTRRPSTAPHSKLPGWPHIVCGPRVSSATRRSAYPSPRRRCKRGS